MKLGDRPRRSGILKLAQGLSRKRDKSALPTGSSQSEKQTGWSDHNDSRNDDEDFTLNHEASELLEQERTDIDFDFDKEYKVFNALHVDSSTVCDGTSITEQSAISSQTDEETIQHSLPSVVRSLDPLYEDQSRLENEISFEETTIGMDEQSLETRSYVSDQSGSRDAVSQDSATTADDQSTLRDIVTAGNWMWETIFSSNSQDLEEIIISPSYILEATDELDFSSDNYSNLGFSESESELDETYEMGISSSHLTMSSGSLDGIGLASTKSIMSDRSASSSKTGTSVSEHVRGIKHNNDQRDYFSEACKPRAINSGNSRAKLFRRHSWNKVKSNTGGRCSAQDTVLEVIPETNDEIDLTATGSEIIVSTVVRDDTTVLPPSDSCSDHGIEAPLNYTRDDNYHTFFDLTETTPSLKYHTGVSNICRRPTRDRLIKEEGIERSLSLELPREPYGQNASIPSSIHDTGRPQRDLSREWSVKEDGIEISLSGHLDTTSYGLNTTPPASDRSNPHIREGLSRQQSVTEGGIERTLSLHQQRTPYDSNIGPSSSHCNAPCIREILSRQKSILKEGTERSSSLHQKRTLYDSITESSSSNKNGLRIAEEMQKDQSFNEQGIERSLSVHLQVKPNHDTDVSCIRGQSVADGDSNNTSERCKTTRENEGDASRRGRANSRKDTEDASPKSSTDVRTKHFREETTTGTPGEKHFDLFRKWTDFWLGSSKNGAIQRSRQEEESCCLDDKNGIAIDDDHAQSNKITKEPGQEPSTKIKVPTARQSTRLVALCDKDEIGFGQWTALLCGYSPNDENESTLPHQERPTRNDKDAIVTSSGTKEDTKGLHQEPYTEVKVPQEQTETITSGDKDENPFGQWTTFCVGSIKKDTSKTSYQNEEQRIPREEDENEISVSHVQSKEDIKAANPEYSNPGPSTTAKRRSSQEDTTNGNDFRHWTDLCSGIKAGTNIFSCHQGKSALTKKDTAGCSSDHVQSEMSTRNAKPGDKTPESSTRAKVLSPRKDTTNEAMSDNAENAFRLWADFWFGSSGNDVSETSHQQLQPILNEKDATAISGDRALSKEDTKDWNPEPSNSVDVPSPEGNRKTVTSGGKHGDIFGQLSDFCFGNSKADANGTSYQQPVQSTLDEKKASMSIRNREGSRKFSTDGYPEDSSQESSTKARMQSLQEDTETHTLGGKIGTSVRHWTDYWFGTNKDCADEFSCRQEKQSTRRKIADRGHAPSREETQCSNGPMAVDVKISPSPEDAITIASADERFVGIENGGSEASKNRMGKSQASSLLGNNTMLKSKNDCMLLTTPHQSCSPSKTEHRDKCSDEITSEGENEAVRECSANLPIVWDLWNNFYGDNRKDKETSDIWFMCSSDIDCTSPSTRTSHNSLGRILSCVRQPSAYCAHCKKQIAFRDVKMHDFIGNPRSTSRVQFHSSCLQERKRVHSRKRKVLRQIALVSYLKKKAAHSKSKSSAGREKEEEVKPRAYEEQCCEKVPLWDRLFRHGRKKNWRPSAGRQEKSSHNPSSSAILDKDSNCFDSTKTSVDAGDGHFPAAGQEILKSESISKFSTVLDTESSRRSWNATVAPVVGEGKKLTEEPAAARQKIHQAERSAKTPSALGIEMTRSSRAYPVPVAGDSEKQTQKPAVSCERPSKDGKRSKSSKVVDEGARRPNRTGKAPSYVNNGETKQKNPKSTLRQRSPSPILRYRTPRTIPSRQQHVHSPNGMFQRKTPVSDLNSTTRLEQASYPRGRTAFERQSERQNEMQKEAIAGVLASHRHGKSLSSGRRRASKGKEATTHHDRGRNQREIRSGSFRRTGSSAERGRGVNGSTETKWTSTTEAAPFSAKEGAQVRRPTAGRSINPYSDCRGIPVAKSQKQNHQRHANSRAVSHADSSRIRSAANRDKRAKSGSKVRR